MNSSTNTVVAGLIGAAGGLALGLFLGSRRGSELRARLSDRIREGSRHVEQQLRGIERQLQELEHVIQESRRGFVERLSRVGRTGSESESGAGWGLSSGEVVSELPHLPRR